MAPTRTIPSTPDLAKAFAAANVKPERSDATGHAAAPRRLTVWDDRARKMGFPPSTR